MFLIKLVITSTNCGIIKISIIPIIAIIVIIDKNNMAVPIQNIGMLISSKVEKAKYEANQLLTKSKKNGLKKDSIVKTDVVYKILNSQILFQVGSIDQDTVKLYKDSYNLLRAPLR